MKKNEIMKEIIDLLKKGEKYFNYSKFVKEIILPIEEKKKELKKISSIAEYKAYEEYINMKIKDIEKDMQSHISTEYLSAQIKEIWALVVLQAAKDLYDNREIVKESAKNFFERGDNGILAEKNWKAYKNNPEELKNKIFNYSKEREDKKK